MTNILKAIHNFSKYNITKIGVHYKNTIRIQQVGDSLEYFIKDLLADSINVDDISVKDEIYSKYFSYLGGTNNPPDLIIKNGDAFEIKKIEHLGGSIALNSSFPKQKLFSDDEFISKACQDCEDWKEKDIVYAIGTIEKKTNDIKSLWLVYGDCYCADRNIYERIKQTISCGVNDIKGVEFSETKELGRVNKIDQLGVTYLRIRGMWGIEHPANIFGYLIKNYEDNILNVIMLEQKFLSFPKNDRDLLDKDDKVKIAPIKIKSPDNPAILLDAVHISIKRV